MWPADTWLWGSEYQKCRSHHRHKTGRTSICLWDGHVVFDQTQRGALKSGRWSQKPSMCFRYLKLGVQMMARFPKVSLLIIIFPIRRATKWAFISHFHIGRCASQEFIFAEEARVWHTFPGFSKKNWFVEGSKVCKPCLAKWVASIRILKTSGYGSLPINTIFRGMNIHLPAILMFTRGTRFWHTAIWVGSAGSFAVLVMAGWSHDGRWPSSTSMPPHGKKTLAKESPQIGIPSGYDIHSLPWKIHPFLRTVNQLFLWAIYTMAMLNNQRVIFNER